MKIRIQPLEERYIDPLAAWHHRQWQHLDSSVNEATRRAGLTEHCQSAKLPMTFIALDNDQLVGSICLVAEEIPDRPQYSPWISRIYVSPEHRGKSIGKALIDRANDVLRQQGHSALYLLTEDKAPYYARMGWRTVEDYQLNNHSVEIMKRVLC